MQQMVLFGAGNIGRQALACLRNCGIEPVAFADTDAKKWDTKVDGLTVMDPQLCRDRYPYATWVATVLSLPASAEVPQKMREMNVNRLPLWTCLPTSLRVRPKYTLNAVLDVLADDESKWEAKDQYQFYVAPDYDARLDYLPMDQIYFPPFIKLGEREHFVDCGADYGDTVEAFLKHCPKYSHITAFEPDAANFAKLYSTYALYPDVSLIDMASSDMSSAEKFYALGDFSSRLFDAEIDSEERKTIYVSTMRLDDYDWPIPPTFIKMDIEGAEPKALWGAKNIIAKYSPVLAVCCYHRPDHYWQLPLLIHALNPRYKLFLRRYWIVPWEIVCYAVPNERVTL
jgi:FkbM family methyltransferase